MTWLDLKTKIRAGLWPQGEQVNLVGIHDTYFMDAFVEIQTDVPCHQQGHILKVPACSTLFDCGLTLFQKPPHASVKALYVADRTDPATHLEDPAAPINYCNRILYTQADWTYFRRYLDCRHHGCCWPLFAYFGLWSARNIKRCYNRPTDAGLPAGLPPLDMGMHYSQASTDAQRRAPNGLWCIERGNIYVAPWIQSSEVVIVEWDGIDRQMFDQKPMDEDPILEKAIREYVRWKHAGTWDHEWDVAQDAQKAFLDGKRQLIEQCFRENKRFKREPSMAQPPITLYWNDSTQTATMQATAADCMNGIATNAPQSATVSVPSGSVSSTVSVSDANSLAMAQAEELAYQQAIAKLVCQGSSGGSGGSGGGSSGGGSGGGGGSTVVTYTAYNAAQTATYTCSDGSSFTATIAAGTVQGTSTLSQSDAQAKADANAFAQANAKAAAQCPSGGGGGGTGGCATSAGGANTVGNTLQNECTQYQVVNGCKVTVTIIVLANTFYSDNQTDANTCATTNGNNYARWVCSQILNYINSGQPTGVYQCNGSYTFNYNSWVPPFIRP